MLTTLRDMAVSYCRHSTCLVLVFSISSLFSGSLVAADGVADILWRNKLTGQNLIWDMYDSAQIDALPLPRVSDPSYTIVGTGDFDGDGSSDYLWRHAITGSNVIWLMESNNLRAASPIGAVRDMNWNVAGVGDMNGDGKADIVWRNSLTGANAIWLMSGFTRLEAKLIPAVRDTSWEIVGVADVSSSASLTGLWTGSSTSSVYPCSGTLSVSFQQTGTSLTGWVDFVNPQPGTQCIPSLSDGITGTVNGNTITFGFSNVTGITFTGTLNGSSLSGSWSRPLIPDSGTWQLTRQ